MPNDPPPSTSKPDLPDDNDSWADTALTITAADTLVFVGEAFIAGPEVAIWSFISNKVNDENLVKKVQNLNTYITTFNQTALLIENIYKGLKEITSKSCCEQQVEEMRNLEKAFGISWDENKEPVFTESFIELFKKYHKQFQFEPVVPPGGDPNSPQFKPVPLGALHKQLLDTQSDGDGQNRRTVAYLLNSLLLNGYFNRP